MSEQYTLNDFLNRLGDYTRHGSGYRACCPAHGGDNPSALSIRPRKDGSFALKCFTRGCDRRAIIAAVMGGPAIRPIATPKPKRKRKSAGRYPWPAPWDRPVAAVYSYRTHLGELLYQKVRFADWRPDGDGRPKYAVRRPVNTRYGWEYNIGDNTRRVLYNLPGVAVSAGPIYIVEGEKDADRLIAAGLCATTNHDGAEGVWLDEYTAWLAMRHVVIIADNDTVGRQHAAHVLDKLKATCLQPRIIVLPGVDKLGKVDDETGPDETGADVSDWLDAGHTIDELIALAAPEPYPRKSAESQPPAVTCDCGKCSGRPIITFWHDAVGISPMTSAGRHECALARSKYTHRLIKQVHAELERADVALAYMTADEYQRWRGRNKKAANPARYLPLHQLGGMVALLNTGGDGHPVPARYDELWTVLDPLVADGDPTKRNRGAADWGADYRGSKGDGRRKSAESGKSDNQWVCSQYVARNKSAKECADLLNIELVNGRGKATMYCLDAYQALVAGGADLRQRKANTPVSWDIFAVAGVIPSNEALDSPLTYIENPQTPMYANGESADKVPTFGDILAGYVRPKERHLEPAIAF